MRTEVDQERFFAETSEQDSCVIGISAGLDDLSSIHVVNHLSEAAVSIPINDRTINELESFIHLYRTWERGTQRGDRASQAQDMWSGH